MRSHALTVAVAAAGLALVLSSCGSVGGTPNSLALPTSPAVSNSAAAEAEAAAPAGTTSQARRPTLLAAGDIGDCRAGDGGVQSVAALAATLSGPMLALGDLAYPDGTQANYGACFWPSWTPLRSRVKAVIGNHDNRNRSVFFANWPSAGTSAKPWYSFTVGSWRVLVVDSNCATTSPGCAAGSPQTAWIASTLAANQDRCTLLAMHHPRFSSDDAHGDTVAVDPLWRAAYAGGVDLVLAGHAHGYERVGPLSAAGRLNTTGPVQLIVGTGGAPLRGFASLTPASRKRIADTFGLARLTLTPGAWRSEFLAAPSGDVRDQASGACR